MSIAIARLEVGVTLNPFSRPLPSLLFAIPPRQPPRGTPLFASVIGTA